MIKFIGMLHSVIVVSICTFMFVSMVVGVSTVVFVLLTI